MGHVGASSRKTISRLSETNDRGQYSPSISTPVGAFITRAQKLSADRPIACVTLDDETSRNSHYSRPFLFGFEPNGRLRHYRSVPVRACVSRAAYSRPAVHRSRFAGSLNYTGIPTIIYTIRIDNLELYSRSTSQQLLSKRRFFRAL